jgi:hypothetical protein
MPELEKELCPDCGRAKALRPVCLEPDGDCRAAVCGCQDCVLRCCRITIVLLRADLERCRALLAADIAGSPTTPRAA